MLLDSWQEHDLLECVANAVPSNAGENPRQTTSQDHPIKTRNIRLNIRCASAYFCLCIVIKERSFMRNRKIESHNIHIDSDYIEWITELKQRYRSAQVKAVIKVNAEKLQFNWLLGRDLVRKKAEERWGSGVVEQLSLDMQRDFPDADGFSVSNLWFMKKWYCFYTQKEANQILYQAGRELAKSKSSRSDSEKLQQPVREFEKTKLHQAGAEMPAFFAGVPWGHHIAIITKCKSVDEALFYIKKTVEQGMSRAALINCIKADLYSHQGKIVNNFTEKLPDLQSKLVQDVLKENYDFGFATVGHEIYDEAAKSTCCFTISACAVSSPAN